MSSENFEKGINNLSEMWERHGSTLISTRLEGALGRDFLFESVGQQMQILRFSKEALAVKNVTDDSSPHAVFSMLPSDWDKVFSGEWSIMTVVLGGRAPFPKHQRRYIMQLSMIIQALLLMEDV